MHYDLLETKELKALTEPNANWALPLYPVFEDENAKWSDKKSVKRQIA